jgi:pseudouridine 5'-phosphatase
VRHLHAHAIPIAIATGSSRRAYNIKTRNLSSVFECFGQNVVCSDDADADADGGDKKKKRRPKPHPDVFLTAAREKLGRSVGWPQDGPSIPEEEERRKGLVFEDAVLGLQAGKRAGMSGEFFFNFLF